MNIRREVETLVVGHFFTSIPSHRSVELLRQFSGISVGRWTESKIHVRVVFDGEMSEMDAEAISKAETELIANFPPRTAVFQV